MTAASDHFKALGSLLLKAGDIELAADAMVGYATHPDAAHRSALASAGVNVRDADAFLALVPNDSERRRQCDLARAWAIGWRSVPSVPSWQPVVTTGELDATGIDRLTAETMIGLIAGAQMELRIFSPFVDSRGIEVLAVPIASATRRGVSVFVGHTVRGNRGNAVDQLRLTVDAAGMVANLRLMAIEPTRPFPHLKIIATDGHKAYIGSANLTWAALTSNAEVGALVDGSPVRSIERWFDQLVLSPDAEPARPTRR